jgi:hypothetical protein
MRRAWSSMIIGAGLAILLLVAGCSQAPTRELAPEPEPVLAVEPWPTDQAGCIVYDGTRRMFVLKNMAPHSIWADLRSTTFELRLPTQRWAATFEDDCGTDRKWTHLPPGASRDLGPIPTKLVGYSTGDGELSGYFKEHGRIDHLPARVQVKIRCGDFGGRITSAEIVRSR